MVIEQRLYAVVIIRGKSVLISTPPVISNKAEQINEADLKHPTMAHKVLYPLSTNPCRRPSANFGFELEVSRSSDKQLSLAPTKKQHQTTLWARFRL